MRNLFPFSMMVLLFFLQNDWNDGKVLVALVESLGGVIVGGVEHGTSVDFLQRGKTSIVFCKKFFSGMYFFHALLL